MTRTTVNVQQPLQPYDELILVIKRETLFADGDWQGMNTASLDTYVSRIHNNKEFMPRSIMETDPCYKQVIPYLVFAYQGSYFLMQRKSKASEQRLQGKYTLGIGGHMRQEDLLNSASIFDWARREFYEEISYDGSFTIKPLGIVNDDSNEVGRVHIGLVLLLEGDSNIISVKEELESGRLASLQECSALGDRLESWSTLIMPFLTHEV